jgi:putative ABC transport system ATP-binding protein
MNSPKLLLADEPTGSLDTLNAQAVLQLLRELRREFGLTLLLATHSEEIAATADRILFLRDGVLSNAKP